MADTTKCKHELCSCTVSDGKSYCSPACEDSKNRTTIACDCNHPGCSGEAVKP